MDKPSRKVPVCQEKEEERVSTAPSTQKHRNVDAVKHKNLQLPMVRGKMLTREGKRVKKQEPKDHEHEEGHKRPQTSKGSRSSKFHDSEFYEEDGDDLLVTTKQEKIELFKKKIQEPPVNSKH